MNNIYSYTDYRQYLQDAFRNWKEKKEGFSHRWLARKLGLSTSNFMLLVMQGKRKLNSSLALKVSDVLKHNAKQAEYFENMVNFLQAGGNRERDRYFQRMMALRRNGSVTYLADGQYEYLSNWYNVIIRELVTFPQFKGDYNWLAKKVYPAITPSLARKSVALLLKLGLLKKTGSGYERAAPVITTGPEVKSLAAVNYHHKMTELAAESLDSLSREDRDITACTMSISEKGYQRIKEVIADCRMQILSIAEEDDPADRVYQANFHLFPVSKIERNPV